MSTATNISHIIIFFLNNEKEWEKNMIDLQCIRVEEHVYRLYMQTV
jgi:hypothetical protein